jgi:ribosomal protein L34
MLKGSDINGKKKKKKAGFQGRMKSFGDVF